MSPQGINAGRLSNSSLPLVGARGRNGQDQWTAIPEADEADMHGRKKRPSEESFAGKKARVERTTLISMEPSP